MSLRRALADYLKTRRALGYKLKEPGRLLPDFVAFLEKRDTRHVTASAAVAWAAKSVGTSPYWHLKRLVMVRGFAKYLSTIDPRTEVPSLEYFHVASSRAVPYVYSPADIAALLSATSSLRGPFMARTYRTLIALLAVTGMRIGEVIALDEHDVDRRRGVLVIRKSKFGKSREIPLHSSSVEALEQYRRDRNRLGPRRSSPSFFISTVGRRLIYNNVHFTFLRLVEIAGLGARRPRPRPHDLRHTFAIQTVVRWHREGLDVEARMPMLSTYLGHVAPSSTYWYLSAVPELLDAAVRRLELVRQ